MTTTSPASAAGDAFRTTLEVYRPHPDEPQFRGVMAFRGLDYYEIDELYTDEERLARDTVRDFVSAEVMPTIGRHFTDGTFPTHLVRAFGELGLLGAS